MAKDNHVSPIDIRIVVKDRIDQHLKFFEIMERIRWQFTSAFGIGAAIGLFLALAGEPSISKTVVGHVLVLGLSIAGIIVQIRIYALVVVIWKRIIILQEYEGQIVKEQVGNSYELTDALLLPRIGVFKSKRLHILTVGMVNCFIFSLISGLSTSLVLHKANILPFWSVMVGGIFSLVLAVFSLLASNRYVKAVEAKDDFIVDIERTPECSEVLDV